jgi:hypothetical protein
MRSTLSVLAALAVAVAGCKARAGPEPVEPWLSYSATPADSVQGTPGFVDVLNQWCEGHRMVPEPFVRTAGIAHARWGNQGAVAIVAVDDAGRTSVRPIVHSHIRLAQDSLFSAIAAAQHVADSTFNVLVAPAGPYWLSVRRIGYLPVVAQVQVRRAVLDTIILPMTPQPIC